MRIKGSKLTMYIKKNRKILYKASTFFIITMDNYKPTYPYKLKGELWSGKRYWSLFFLYVSKQYKTDLWPFCQRMSNNSNPKFTDEELLTIFMYGIMQRRFELKDIYNYTCNHLREWFPHLPSYVAFVQRLNRFESLFPMLIELILKDFSESDIAQQIRLIDTMPIILANAKRSSSAKVANQFANKGYCSSKGISTSVSKIRQPIESLFNWIQEKTKIQIASKVRSYQGLMVHVFGKLAAAMFILVFNP